ncbi:helix-turn-helix transcriptional regulator [Kutzneria kofuensis]|uniref:Putative DNA-binding transcriptional regulator AlpA n=1 Tax=Kutzneria kofuensis TaxID=103725 RepID=A0A7W9KIE7_9PSEU|nr:helix-turn-helix domain-containing protein [Kutzneria kofuensis]MBB5893177.1 putative DNA-binding transcriptional regulator AlpA [Kutzneria kofuensis]
MTSALPDPNQLLTVDEFCAAARVSKNTFYKWRQIPGAAPVARKLPNGSLRILVADYLMWLDGRRSDAA